MPRNASGTYTLPSGNPVVSGTVIESTWANNTLGDLADSITGSLSRAGEGGMTGPFRAADGTLAVPSIAFANENATGIYRVSAGIFAFVVGGVEIARFTSSGFGIASGKNLVGPVSVSGSMTVTNNVNVTGTGYSPNQALTDAATIAWDTDLGQVATFTFVSSNRTVGAPTNLKNGAFYALAIIQNAGSNTLTWNSVFKFAGGVAPTLSTAAGAKDYLVFRSDGTNLYEQGRSLGVA
jgi:hypothetical protein